MFYYISNLFMESSLLEAGFINLSKIHFVASLLIIPSTINPLCGQVVLTTMNEWTASCQFMHHHQSHLQIKSISRRQRYQKTYQMRRLLNDLINPILGF